MVNTSQLRSFDPGLAAVTHSPARSVCSNHRAQRNPHTNTHAICENSVTGNLALMSKGQSDDFRHAISVRDRHLHRNRHTHAHTNTHTPSFPKALGSTQTNSWHTLDMRPCLRELTLHQAFHGRFTCSCSGGLIQRLRELYRN